MATAAFETPKLKAYPVIPLVQVGAMAHSKPYVASAPIQTGLGFPGELVEDWQSNAPSPRWASCSASTARCRSTWTPACTAAPAPTSATTSSAPATRRTCRWRART